MPRSFKAKWEKECTLCHELILEGDEAFFPERGKIAHWKCPRSYSPPAASSVGQGGPKEVGGVASGSGEEGRHPGISVPPSPPAALPEDVEEPWVQIAVWIRINRLEMLAKAIKEARS